MYWMSRDQRLHNNWALLFAQQKAKEYNVPLIIGFVLTEFLDAPLRHYAFMLEGLAQLAATSSSMGIPFFLLQGDPIEELPRFVREAGIGAVVSDFSPLRVGRQWREGVAQSILVPMVEVDAHNIVPTWVASQKAEFAAYTFRPKVHKLLPEFMEEFPQLEPQSADQVEMWRSGAAPALRSTEYHWSETVIDWQTIYNRLRTDRSVDQAQWLKSGEAAGAAALERFLTDRLAGYAQKRNDPSQEDGQSDLSPYLHYGQLSAQRVALAVERASERDSTLRESVDAFLEELIVRRELSDNFCLYTPEYDTPAAWPAWAKETHDQHRRDPRDITYALEQLEHSQTHDPAWNAAQNELKQRGKMHGYMRMYWAKKILEWTSSPEEALQFAIILNDKYLLDGRDPNGYAGIQWSIGGVHDRPWFERPVFGKIRYMNFNGLKRKFNIEAYIAQWAS